MIRRLLLPGLIGVAVYYAVFGGEYTAFELRDIRLEVEQTRIALEEAKAATESLQARAERLEQDPRTIEALARESFGMIRDDEILYRFVD